jgi:hypothetical protein
MVRANGVYGRGRMVVLVLLVPYLLLTHTGTAQAQTQIWAPSGPVAFPAAVAVGGTAAAGAVVGPTTAGATWTAAGGAVAGVGVLPFVAGAAAAVLLGGALYVGYRHLSGNPIEWWWQDGDPQFDANAQWSCSGDCDLAWEVFEVSAASDGLRIHFEGRTWQDYYGTLGATERAWWTAEWVDDTRAPLRSYSVGSLDGGWYTLSTWSSGTSRDLGVATWQGCVAINSNTTSWSVAMGTATTCDEAVAAGVARSLTSSSAAIASEGFYPAGTQVRIKAMGWCAQQDDPTAGEMITAYSTWYDIAGPPQPIPTLVCPAGHRLDEVWITREVDVPGAEPLTITEGPVDRPAPIPPPSWVPSPQHDLWDEMQDGRGSVEMWETGPGPERKLEPETDTGWETRADRDTNLSCRWYHPNGQYIEMPLEECYGLQWQVTTDPGTGQQVIQQPALGPGTTTQLPPADSPTTARSCSNDSTESGFLGSKIIARGVQCALEWAFVPITVGQQTATLKQDLEARPPVSIATTLVPTLTAIHESYTAEEDCGFDPIVQNIPGYGTVAESAFPCTPPYQAHPVWQAAYAFMAASIVAGAALLVWNLSTAALNGSKAGGGD